MTVDRRGAGDHRSGIAEPESGDRAHLDEPGDPGSAGRSEKIGGAIDDRSRDRLGLLGTAGMGQVDDHPHAFERGGERSGIAQIAGVEGDPWVVERRQRVVERAGEHADRPVAGQERCRRRPADEAAAAHQEDLGAGERVAPRPYGRRLGRRRGGDRLAQLDQAAAALGRERARVASRNASVERGDRARHGGEEGVDPGAQPELVAGRAQQCHAALAQELEAEARTAHPAVDRLVPPAGQLEGEAAVDEVEPGEPVAAGTEELPGWGRRAERELELRGAGRTGEGQSPIGDEPSARGQPPRSAGSRILEPQRPQQRVEQRERMDRLLEQEIERRAEHPVVEPTGLELAERQGEQPGHVPQPTEAAGFEDRAQAQEARVE